MARKKRLVAPGLAHHVTQRGNNRQAVFFTEDDRRLWLEMFFEQAERWHVKVAGYCLMTNHIHVLCVPSEPEGVSRAMCRVQSDYARLVNLRRGMCGHLWHERFYCCPMADCDAMRALAYIELNPVRAGMVAHAIQHPWSSAKAHILGFDPENRLDFTLWLRGYTPERWREVLASGIEEAWQQRFRRATLCGTPLGPDEFVARMEEHFGRRLRAKRVGRPGAPGERTASHAA